MDLSSRAAPSVVSCCSQTLAPIRTFWQRPRRKCKRALLAGHALGAARSSSFVRGRRAPCRCVESKCRPLARRLKIETTKLDLLLAARRPRFEDDESGKRSAPVERVARVRFCLCSASSAAIVASRSARSWSALRADGASHASSAARPTSRRFRRICFCTRGAASAALAR